MEERIFACITCIFSALLFHKCYLLSKAVSGALQSGALPCSPVHSRTLPSKLRMALRPVPLCLGSPPKPRKQTQSPSVSSLYRSKCLASLKTKKWTYCQLATGIPENSEWKQQLKMERLCKLQQIIHWLCWVLAGILKNLLLKHPREW